MDNLRKSIQILFGELCPDNVLNKHYSRLNFNEELYEKDFFINGQHYFDNYNSDELKNVYQKLYEDWFLDVYDCTNSKSIFNILTHFNKQVLTEENTEPFVHFENLLKWRELSYQLGEDLFTCSYLAYMDNRSKRDRHFFSWRPVIFSNNKRLKSLLNEGVAENHFHLKGSGPVFDLSWMALMNNINKFHSTFQLIKSEMKLKSSISNSFSDSKKEVDVLVYKAAYIRSFLFCKINNTTQDIPNHETILSASSNSVDSIDILNYLSKIQDSISSLKYLFGYSFYHKGNQDIADYSIPKNLHQSNFEGSFMLVGERKFLYDCFSKIYSGNTDFKKYEKLFHTYLLIKSTFRAELIQINKKVGFGNFLMYQNRKESFLPSNSIYETAFLSMAINDTQKFQKIHSFETRIAPKNNVIDFYKSLDKYKKDISKKSISEHYSQIDLEPSLNTEKHFYVVHFIKKKDEINENSLISNHTFRHLNLRKEVKNQARAITDLRESHFERKNLIRGIDAASSEFDANPEVFAQAFRYLKDHKLRNKYSYLDDNINEIKLRATFHVGEDFYDIIDGLRSIDEAINFLNLRQGDRLGHALALGIDINEYFNFKGKQLMIPKEVLLDNIAWLLAQVTKFNITKFNSETDRLSKMFENLFWEIYSDNFESNLKNDYFSHSMYYKAWQLRGDDPSLYFDYRDDIESKINTTYWERCRLNYFFPKDTNIRKNERIKFLYHSYHYNSGVKKTGKKN